LYNNDKWMRADTQELYNLIVWVAQSPSQFKEQVVSAIRMFLRDHIVDAN